MSGSLATILIFLPLAGALFIWLLPVGRLAGSFALLFALAEIGFWINGLAEIDFDAPGVARFDQKWTWFSDLGVSYHVGYFAFSFWLAGLATVVMAAAIAYGFWVGRERPRAYFGLMLFLTSAVDRRVLLAGPVAFLRLLRGHVDPALRPDRRLGRPRADGCDGQVRDLHDGGLAAHARGRDRPSAFPRTRSTWSSCGTSDSTWLFLGFAVAFAVKAPLFPFHGWLPDAYRESSPEVAAVLSGLISKAAVFGFITDLLRESSPARSTTCSNVILALAVVGLVYGSLLAFRAPDIRGVIAYSSLAQMGLITIGIFAGNAAGLSGAVLQSVNHGLISATLFLLAGTVERRTSTGLFSRLGGMARGRPALATMLMVTGVIALAVPGSLCVRRGVPDPRRDLQHRLGLGRGRRDRDRARRDVHAPPDFSRPAPGAGTSCLRVCSRPSARRAGHRGPARRVSARPVCLACGDQRQRLERTDETA